jgi:hypothetical protein
LIALSALMVVPPTIDKLFWGMLSKKNLEAAHGNSTNVEIDGTLTSYIGQLKCAIRTLQESLTAKV